MNVIQKSDYSVLLPYYKKRMSLLKALKSVLEQTVLPTEIILIEDSYEKIFNKEYFLKNLDFKNINLKFFKNNKNIGLAKSLNFGLKKTETNLIFRIDDDDLYLKNHAETYLKEFYKNSDYLIYSQEIKKKFNYLNLVKDDFLIFDNLSIHSSWMINLNINKRFRYIDLNPEDYASLSFYMRRDFKLKIIRTNSVVYNDNPDGMSKKTNANRHIDKIRKANFLYFKKKYIKKGLIYFIYKMFTKINLFTFFKIKI
tara:strand:+ start:1065 stop:1829 length:765 start_codon:yes stop_codon:yes gene_type:complete